MVVTPYRRGHYGRTTTMKEIQPAKPGTVTSLDVFRALRANAPVGADGQWPRKAYVGLVKGETAWDPSSTKRLIEGPATVTYIEWKDGGLDAKVEVPTS
jgi:hypothetical protein